MAEFRADLDVWPWKGFVPGLTPQMVWTFRGAESPGADRRSKADFCVKELSAFADIAGHSERDLIIVRFDKKKDHRELQTTNGRQSVHIQGGISEKTERQIPRRGQLPVVYMVMPNEDLKPGEHMVTFSALGNSRCDFRISH